MRRVASLLLAAVLVAASGCGSSGSPGDPAALAPRDAVVFAEATLDPEGDQEEAVRSIVSKFPGEREPGELVAQLFDKAAREEGEDFTWEKDVEPWLGDKAAAFVNDIQADDAQYGLLIKADDEDKARDFVEKSGPDDAPERSFEDVDYVLDDGTAVGVTDGWLIAGTEPGLKAAVRALKGDEDDTLEGSDRFEQAMEGADEDRLGSVYVDLEFLGKMFEQAGAGQLGDLYKGAYVTTVSAEPDAAVFESRLPAEGNTLFALGGAGEGTPLVGEAPDDAWLVLGAPDLGRSLGRLVDAFAAQIGGREGVEKLLRQSSGLDLDQDVLSWMGDYALWVRGTSERTLGGALVIETSDPGATRRALRGLSRVAGRDTNARIRERSGGGFSVSDPDIPQPIHFAVEGERFVIAYGDEALEAAADPSGTLAENADFRKAAGSLGDGLEPSAYVDVQPILELAGTLAPAAEFKRALPYLEPLDFLVGGARKEGDELLSRMRLGFE